MERALEAHAHEVCAVIVEPLIQWAGGMGMYHPLYLTMLREACDRHGVHLIADEIAVGFGRTGRMFGCDWAPPPHHDRDAQPGITPDFMCLSKGITGGTMALAVTLTRESIYAAFDRSEESRVGKEGVRTCRSRWSPYHSNKTKNMLSNYTYKEFIKTQHT